MTQDDPYIWLEDKDGARPLAWVEAGNKRTGGERGGGCDGGDDLAGDQLRLQLVHLLQCTARPTWKSQP